MEKKKLKLSISGSSKKTFSSIEQAKNNLKNSVVIEKKTGKGFRKACVFCSKWSETRQSSKNQAHLRKALTNTFGCVLLSETVGNLLEHQKPGSPSEGF